MKQPAQAQARLEKLAAQGALPASECGPAFLKLLAPLLQGGVLELKRSGGGQILSVTNGGALRDFCRQRFPGAALTAEAGSRVRGVARFRDSKAMTNQENEIVTVRSWREDALLKKGMPAGSTAATAAHGVFSFLLTRDCPYGLRGACALVENPAVFMVAEQLNLDVDLVIYGHGRISNRVMDWLTHSMADFYLLHLPDYDPTGLSEFQRLHARLGRKVSLHLPPDLETRFAQFSNPDLLKKGNSQAMLAQLRSSTLPGVLAVVTLIDRYNAGLEQEALSIDLPASLPPRPVGDRAGGVGVAGG